MYKSIYDQHLKDTTYTFDEEARSLYVQFSNNIVQEMNKQLEEQIILQDNLSKDRKIFLRYSILN